MNFSSKPWKLYYHLNLAYGLNTNVFVHKLLIYKGDCDFLIEFFFLLINMCFN